jgi:hypothetical protein
MECSSAGASPAEHKPSLKKIPISLWEALSKVLSMKHPSVSGLLRKNGYGFEADCIDELSSAFEAAKKRDMRIRRFSLGQLVATPGAIEALARTREEPFAFLERHISGDWGDLGDGDKRENERSLDNGCRILSAYHLSDDTKIWVITEADRSATTILLPEEY